MNILTVNDAAAGTIGYVFAQQFALTKPTHQAIQSLIVSSVARMLSESSLTNAFTSLNTGQKNEIIVGVLSAVCSSVQNRSVMKGTIAGMSIDLLAEDVVRLLGLSDKSLLGTTTFSQTPTAKNTGPSTI
jgi:hypothetical protein